MFKADVIAESEKNLDEAKDDMEIECEKKKEKAPEPNSKERRKPTCIIVLGMAGSGKTTFVKKITSTLYNSGKPYVINLDPACSEVPYPANIGKKKKKKKTDTILSNFIDNFTQILKILRLPILR